MERLVGDVVPQRRPLALSIPDVLALVERDDVAALAVEEVVNCRFVRLHSVLTPRNGPASSQGRHGSHLHALPANRLSSAIDRPCASDETRRHFYRINSFLLPLFRAQNNNQYGVISPPKLVW